MKAFHTVAVPTEIFGGRLLWMFCCRSREVAQNRGPEEYRDATTFSKTYLTENLKELLAGIENDSGRRRDSVIQLQTPFGGGKTHSLIALYHKAKEWAQNRVIDGTTPSVEQETLGE